MILPFFSNLVSPLVSITPAAVAMPDKASPIIPGKDTVVIEDLPPIQEETQPEVKIAPVPPRKPEMQGPPIPQVYGPPAPVDYGPHLPEPVTAEPVVAEQVTPFVSAFDPRAWAQPTADFFEAYTAGTAGSNFLKNYREIQGSRADQEYKRMIASAQLLNALKSKSGTSEAEKLQAKAAFLRGMGASDNEILQSFLKGSGTTINIGEKSAQRRTQNMDDLMAKRIEEDMAQLALNDNVMALGDVVLQAFENGQLSYVGKPFAEEVYKYGAKFGWLPESTQAAVQALQTLGTNYRAATLRPTVGGGQVSNIEQQIAGVAVPGVDKTEAQNKTAIRAAVGLARALRAAHNAYVAAYYRGALEPEAAQVALRARHAYTEQLYKDLGLAGQTKPNVGDTRVVNGVTYKRGEDGKWHKQ